MQPGRAGGPGPAKAAPHLPPSTLACKLTVGSVNSFLGRGDDLGADAVDSGAVTRPADADAGRAILDPATGEPIASVADSDAAAVEAAVTAARLAFPAWAARTPKERCEALLALAQRLEDDGEELAALECGNVGKPATMAAEEIEYAVDGLRLFAAAARCLRADASGEFVAEHTSSLRREPVGVVGAIAPWNYPLLMATWKVGPALAAGNTCVLKPSEQTPLSALRLAEHAAATLGAGPLTVVTGDGEVGAALARHPSVAMVSVTGSTATGRAVTHAAADRIARVHLELGGNAPVLVFDDADLEATVEGIRTAGYWNAGQECAAACRVIATPGIHDALLEALTVAVASIQLGGPADAGAEMGPLISEAHRRRVLGFLDRARAAGARILSGGRPRDPGFFLEPTLVAGVDQGAEIVQEEVFGPVVTVQRAADEDEALRWAGDVVQGLSASVWTADLARAQRCARALRFGTVWINDHLALAPEMPWTGFGQSGHGHDQSIYAVEDYTQLKHVMVKAS
ncbi:MAG: aminobutyraldehyde dehydrogenase [Actinobacteria bacterium]|nr:aminobutyraldehyde dehydrogenase [Actinomycetota bacterium]